MIQYSTNLTDKQWQVIEKIINTQERKRKHSLRNITVETKKKPLNLLKFRGFHLFAVILRGATRK